ncbi:MULTISPECIES: tripartite tricarboxylate transporter substrate binding protein [unclassified Variovorax]|uniref:Bug family tripartite tricarboxylate transporter substrate binding protein n=1 Tax=unclassified Variovorax TaxID=663243 RepID=UPI0008D0269C|nr:MULTISPECIES: tripartite tricarboxylate transporter substrate binding protein [unclassified Variovorax]SEJ13415.1 Tripartite-type tricarboxylate transporter, receptor component TctC [Variovorax sp. OK202]SFC03903.1 Tripartite-type tricarboxylate transporter, receptor component TctC [Variovorax sp. OK212]
MTSIDLSRRRLMAALAATAGGAALAALPHRAFAQQQLPPLIKLVVGYSAGGPVDGAARLLAPGLSQELGTQVIVDNRPGASGSLGGDAVAKAAPDGAMLFFGASPTITINPNVQRKMAFDPMKDLTPIAPLVDYTNVLVINNDVPVRNVAELLAYAKTRPGKVFYGSAGVGASNHLSGALLEKMTGVQLTHVPYKGSAPALADVMGGTVTMMFDIIATSKPFIQTGKVRALAVTSRQRNRMLPDVPTMIESGVPGYDVGGWFGLYGPARMDAALAARINAAAQKMLAREDIAHRLREQGYDVWSGGADLLASKGQSDRRLWATASKGIEAE